MRRFPPIALAFLILAATAIHSEPGPTPKTTAVVSRIKRIPVESTALAAVGYSKKLRALEIEFRNGAIYRYFDVEPAVYDDLLNAESKARFYDQFIRHKYPSVHVRRRSE
jgi:hypothetical protein